MIDLQINIEELNRVKEEIFEAYIENKYNIINEINNEVEKLLQDALLKQEQEELIDE